MRLTQISIW